MLPVTPAFKTAIDDTTRRFKVRAQVDWEDNAINHDASVVASSTFDTTLTPASQAADGIAMPQRKWFQFDDPDAGLDMDCYMIDPLNLKEAGWSSGKFLLNL